MKLNQILPSYLLLENIISYLSKHLNDKLLTAYRNDILAHYKSPNSTSIEILKQLQAADFNNKYLQWLAREYINKSFRLEDINRVKNVLKQFHKNKHQLKKKDIYQYSFHELEDIIDNLTPEMSKTQKKLKIKKEGADVVKQGSDGTVLKLKTKEAACYYGKGTKWCTAGDKDNVFDEYNEEGPLYVFISNDGRKFQFHFESWQFMDERDREINVKEVMEKYPTVNSFFKRKEKEFATNAITSYHYAESVIEGRFPEGEKIIATDVLYSYYYAMNVIEGRFPEGEKIIATDVVYSYYYALNVIEGRFPEGEKIIATDVVYSYYYALNVIKGRFLEGEKVIATDDLYSYYYARDVIKGRFLEGEKVIATDDLYSYYYAVNVIKGRFSKGEKIIATDARYLRDYKRFLNSIK
jgi:hypothetical protein